MLVISSPPAQGGNHADLFTSVRQSALYVARKERSRTGAQFQEVLCASKTTVLALREEVDVCAEDMAIPVETDDHGVGTSDLATRSSSA